MENKQENENIEQRASLNITREELALCLSKYIEENNINIPAVLVLFPPYDDEECISEDARIAVNQMRNTGLMQSKRDNLFEPKAKVTIEELFGVFKKFNEKVNDTHYNN